MTLAQVLAEFAHDLRYEDLPESVLTTMKLHLADGVGVAFAGLSYDYAAPLLALGRTRPEPEEAVIWGTTEWTTAETAALVNGGILHGLDFDDTHTSAHVHPTAVTAATVFPVGSLTKASGKDVLVAAAVAYETVVRLGLAAPGTFHSAGYHATALCGTFAAALATAKLLGGDVRAMTNALAIAGSQSAGLHEYSSNYRSWMKRLHPGWAAHSGILGAQLAVNGFTGPDTVFEGDMGFYKTHVGSDWHPEAITADLGTSWQTEGIAFKPYPSCHFTHSFIDAAKHIRTEVDLADIDKVVCDVPRELVNFVCEPAEIKVPPESDYAAKFSLPFCVATAFVHGTVDLGSFRHAGLTDATVLDLASRVGYKATTDSGYPNVLAARMVVHLRNGDELVHEITSSRGTPGAPIQAEDVREKFAANCSTGERAALADSTWSAFMALEDVDVRTMLARP